MRRRARCSLPSQDGAMSMQQEYSTNVRLWFACTVLVYVLWMILYPVARKNEGVAIGWGWVAVVEWTRAGEFWLAARTALGLLIYCGLPAIVLGWCLHALVFRSSLVFG